MRTMKRMPTSRFDILRKQKTLIDKAYGGGRLKQALIEYIAKKRR